jgi:hypothetical protein
MYQFVSVVVYVMTIILCEKTFTKPMMCMVMLYLCLSFILLCGPLYSRVQLHLSPFSKPM